MLHIKRWSLAASLVVSLAALAGCVALAVGAAAGVGTYAYVTGSLKGDLEGSLDKVYEASQDAVKSLEFSEGLKAKDAIQGFVEAKMADGTKVSIKLKKKTDTVTSVVIRVGVFGDEKQSVMIWEEIKKHL